MAVSLAYAIRWLFIFIFLIFHCAVTYFIFVMRHRKNKTYTSLFFLLYLMLSIADIGTILNNFFLTKFTDFDFMQIWIYKNPMYNTVLRFVSGYFLYFQAILHAAIAMNRVWKAFTVTAKSAKIKTMEKMGKQSVWLLPALAFALNIPRFFGHSEYYYGPDGNLFSSYVEPFLKTYQTVAGSSVVLSTSFIAFVLTLITIIRYRYLLTRYQHTNNQMSVIAKQDIILFIQATVVLCFQLSIAAYYIMTFIASANAIQSLTTFALQYYNHLSDIASLVNPVTLLLVCKFIRKDFRIFLEGFYKKTGTSSPWVSNGN